jgi:ABC-type antimicrobial peptide transport system permease subunit
MFRNYLKVAWRNLVKSKGYSLINIGGLAIGMAVAMLIGLWIYHELSFDRYHTNHARIAQVMQHASFNGKMESQVSVPAVLGPELRAKYGSDFKHVIQASWVGSHLLNRGDKQFIRNGLFMEPGAPEMLSLRMIKGSGAGLKDPYAMLISASTAEAIFGKEDPIGKTLKLNRTTDLKVAGVFEDIPANSSFTEVKILMAWELWMIQNPWAKNMENPWGSNFCQTFVQIADHADMEAVSRKIRDTKLKNAGAEEARYKWQVFLHPMGKWNLYNEFRDGVNTGGAITYVWMFGLIGVFVLLLACINFMNLSTARSEKRAKEVGIRKTVGSLRGQLVRQFFMESYLVAFIGFVASIGLVILLLPVFNDVSGRNLQITWANPVFWAAGLGFVLLTGLLAGSYPALYLSSFQPLKVLKGTYRAGRAASLPRKVLVVVQFTVSIMLIIGTIVIYQQVQHAKNRPIGYARNGLINLTMQDEIRTHFDAMRADLVKTGAIAEMAASNSPLTQVWNTNGGINWEGKDPNLAVDFPNNTVSFDFGKTVQWKVIKGRDFSRDFATDSLAFVVNESAATFIGFKDPIGKTLKWNDRNYTIIGVVGDLMQESPFYPVRPTLYHTSSYDDMYNLFMRLSPSQPVASSIAEIEATWKKYVPEVPFEYSFVDERFAEKFANEERIGKLSAYFAILAIFISCLGILGLASFVAEQRTKEIGIRKVLGASVPDLWQMLSREFVLMVLISCVLAGPIANYFMDQWLTGYDYRIRISAWVFIWAGLGALLITLLTVSAQAIRAALANPVHALRSE